MFKFLIPYFTTNYVSELDEFLQNFIKNHPEPSASQHNEVMRHKKISQLRDTIQ